jgi:hypothetical protein
MPYMGDNVGNYRPHEIPANRHITDGAVDAGGTLRGFVLVDHGPLCPAKYHLEQQGDQVVERVTLTATSIQVVVP